MIDKFRNRLRKIIKMSFRTLEMKLANGGITSKNEASFQLKLGYILKIFGQLYEFHPNQKFNLEMESYVELKENSIKVKIKSGHNNDFSN